MILAHKQIEKIAAAVTHDFNEFFSGKRLTKLLYFSTEDLVSLLVGRLLKKFL